MREMRIIGVALLALVAGCSLALDTSDLDFSGEQDGGPPAGDADTDADGDADADADGDADADADADADTDADTDADGDADTDADTDADADADGDADTDTDSDSDTSTGDEVCVRFVDVAVANPGDASSWEQAAPTVQEGIGAASSAISGEPCSAAQVWVAAGEYVIYQGSADDTVALVPWVDVYGGFQPGDGSLEDRDPDANLTTLNGYSEDDDAHVLHVVTGADDVTIDGFTITGGEAFGSPSPADRGGGMYNSHVSPHVRDCVFYFNSASIGGAIYNEGGSDSPTVESCEFLLNSADTSGGAVYNDGASPNLNFSAFVGNSAEGGSGGAVHNTGGASPMITNNSFYTNTASENGGAISSEDTSTPIVTENVFVSNSAQNGGAAAAQGAAMTIGGCIFQSNASTASGGAVLSSGSTMTVSESIFAGNTAANHGGAIKTSGGSLGLSAVVLAGNQAAWEGGGLQISDSSPSMANCTVVGNQGANGGGVATEGGSAPTVTNSILWGNVPASTYTDGGPEIVITFSDVEGGDTMNNNINTDPLFRGGPLLSGHTLTSVTFDSGAGSSLLGDASANWEPGSLEGMYIRPVAWDVGGDPRWLYIIGNTEVGINVHGDVTGWVTTGDEYEIHDLRLGVASPCIDAADAAGAPSADVLGTAPVDHPFVVDTGVGFPPYVDLGAYEQDGLLVEWVGLPGGTFSMGSDSDSTEQPPHDVTVPAFEITRTEITVRQYTECINDAACGNGGTGTYCNFPAGRTEHPMNCISWADAHDFCAWLDPVQGARLPTEAEWEYAARSGGLDVVYPWGDTLADCTLAVMDESSSFGCGDLTTSPVCSRTDGNTYQGLCDMAGNINELVEDWYHSSYNLGGGDVAPDDGSAWLDPAGTERVWRGGAFSNPSWGMRTRTRYSAPQDNQEYYLGFRCAR